MSERPASALSAADTASRPEGRSPVEATAGGHVAPSGNVFDIGYQRYAGRREGRWRSRLAVYEDGIRAAMGLGRGGRAKVLPWLFIASLCLVGFVMALIAGAAERIVGATLAEQLDLPSHSDFYGIASILLFVFAAVRAPELLCPDRRDGTLHLYLVRPLSGSDYVASRWTAFLTVVAAVAWLPQLILLVGLVMGDPDPVAYLRTNWIDVPRLLAAGLAFATYTTSLAMLVASFTTRRAYASVFLVGLFVITTPFTTGVAIEVGGTLGAWISMFNLSNIPVHVNDLIFGEVSAITSVAPARDLPPAVLVAWYLLWTAGPAALLWARYRRLTP